MLRKTGIRPPDVIYFVSRQVLCFLRFKTVKADTTLQPCGSSVFDQHTDLWRSVGHILRSCSCSCTLRFTVASVKNCHAVGLAQGWTAAFQYIFNALLFVFRIRAVFYHQRYIVWFFYFMWIAVVATCLVAPFGLDAVALPPTGLCVDTRLSHSSAGGIIVAAINDTAIFTFITVKLVLQAHGAENLKSFFKILFSGKGMGHVSRVVLQTGQLYYLSVPFHSSAVVAYESHVL